MPIGELLKQRRIYTTIMRSGRPSERRKLENIDNKKLLLPPKHPDVSIESSGNYGKKDYQSHTRSSMQRQSDIPLTHSRQPKTPSNFSIYKGGPLNSFRKKFKAYSIKAFNLDNKNIKAPKFGNHYLSISQQSGAPKSLSSSQERDFDTENNGFSLMTKRGKQSESHSFGRNEKKSPQRFNMERSKFEKIKSIMNNHPYSFSFKTTKHKTKYSDNNNLVMMPLVQSQK